MRLVDFHKLGAVPADVLFDLILTNKLPLTIDEQGYICISIQQKSIQTIIDTIVKEAVQIKEKSQSSLKSKINGVISEEFAKLIEELEARNR